jgi:phosphate transport system protein
MPKKFDQELDALKADVVRMGEDAAAMIRAAMKALVDRDEAPIAEVLRREEDLDRAQVGIDDHVVRLIVTHAPVAYDLRLLLMIARMNSELERIGDQAVNICENVRLLLGVPPLKPLVDLPRMADLAQRMVAGALDAFVRRSPDRALETIEADDQVDALNDQIFRELLTYMVEDPRNIPRAIALLLTARALERIADHATNICEEVVYMVKGQDIRHSGKGHGEGGSA